MECAPYQVKWKEMTCLQDSWINGWKKLSDIAMNRAPSMIGNNSIFVTLLKQHSGRQGDELIQFHCTFNQDLKY